MWYWSARSSKPGPPGPTYGCQPAPNITSLSDINQKTTIESGNDAMIVKIVTTIISIVFSGSGSPPLGFCRQDASNLSKRSLMMRTTWSSSHQHDFGFQTNIQCHGSQTNCGSLLHLKVKASSCQVIVCLTIGGSGVPKVPVDME